MLYQLARVMSFAYKSIILMGDKQCNDFSLKATAKNNLLKLNDLIIKINLRLISSFKCSHFFVMST